MSVTDRVAGAIDAALELPIVPSFTRVGIAVRSRLDDWAPVRAGAIAGRVVVLTGATSGLGLEAAEQLAVGGATVVITGRDRGRVESTAARLRAASGSESIDPVAADMAEPADVAELGEHVVATHQRVDVVIHNAGALSAQREENSESLEATVAAQVLGPFRLTSLLMPALRRTARSTGRPSRVLTMSSGGMYAVPLSVTGLQMSADEYDGTRQYALAKRAQVTLNQLWAERVPPSEVVFHALHPGWADTPGVRSSLPAFAQVVGPLLRSPAEGADTVTWLASDDGEPLASSGGFWLDRRTRPIHRLARTRRSDTPQRREQLWNWCVEHSGVTPPP